MALEIFNGIGWSASFFTLIMFFPQTVKVIKTKDTSTLSKKAFSISIFGAIMWVMLSPFAHSLQAGVANLVTLILLSPIVFYLWKDQKKIMIGLLVTMAIFFIVSVVFWFIQPTLPLFLKYFFIIGAGLAVGFGLLPQTIKVIKTKELGSLSMYSALLILLANVTRLVYWSGKSYYETGDMIILGWLLVTFLTIGFIIQIPVLYIFFKSKMKNK